MRETNFTNRMDHYFKLKLKLCFELCYKLNYIKINGNKCLKQGYVHESKGTLKILMNMELH